MWSVFVNDDGHKRGQASSPDVGAEIQTYCNFEAHISHCSHLLGFLKFRRVVVFFKLPHNLMAWPYRHITIFANLNHLVHKDFFVISAIIGLKDVDALFLPRFEANDKTR